MAFIQWRRFDFFSHSFLEKKTESSSPKFLINEQENGENLDTFGKLKKIKITCSDSGRGKIILGDQFGCIHQIDSNLEMESFQAHDKDVVAIQQIIQHPYLITAGTDDTCRNVIKIWNLDKLDPHKQMPICMRSIKTNLVMQPNPNSKISSFKATDALTFICIGYDDGNLITIRGDLLKEKSCKQKKVELCKDVITGIFLRGTYQSNHQNQNFLNNRLLPLNLRQQQTKQVSSFITTTSQVYFFEMKNDQEEWNLIENDFGCTTGRYCCLIDDGKYLDNCLFILGNEKGIYFYQNDGRGPCLPFGNEKLILKWYKGYLIVISKENLPFTSKLKQDSPLNSVVDSANDNQILINRNLLTIYDIRNKYIAFSSTFSSINQIFAEWGYIFVLLHDGRLVRIREKDMNDKLDVLFKKQQYSLAIELAKHQNFNSDNLTDIYKEFADYLYKQGEFEPAINQYIKTIGKLEPSYVIRRYLEGQKVKNLSSYLCHLHNQGLANKDHTSLYLNCLTKSENKDSLISFLKVFETIKTRDNRLEKDEEFEKQLLDVQNAIQVLRKSKLYDEALHLSVLYKCYDLYFKIQIEDKSNYTEAIKFIQTKLLNEKDLFFNQYFVKYAKLLFSEKPEETTQLLKQICRKVLKAVNEEIEPVNEEGNIIYLNSFFANQLISNFFNFFKI